jgi:hypothetical protein
MLIHSMCMEYGNGLLGRDLSLSEVVVHLVLEQ